MPARSRTAAKATSDGATSVADWKKPDLPVELPSGKKIRIKRSSFQAFIKFGIIPNGLMAEVQSALAKGVEPDIAKLAAGDEAITEMIAMVDNVIVFVAIEPRVYPLPSGDEEKDDNLLYVDEIDEEDKMFIFQYVTGGTKDIAQFREEATKSLADIPGITAVARPAKRTSRSAK